MKESRKGFYDSFEVPRFRPQVFTVSVSPSLRCQSQSILLVIVGQSLFSEYCTECRHERAGQTGQEEAVDPDSSTGGDKGGVREANIRISESVEDRAKDVVGDFRWVGLEIFVGFDEECGVDAGEQTSLVWDGN